MEGRVLTLCARIDIGWKVGICCNITKYMNVEGAMYV